MRKVQCLYMRDFSSRPPRITSDTVAGCEWALDPNEPAVATIKFDGTACLIWHGLYFARYDAKRGREHAPAGWFPCMRHPDPVTGHDPGWRPVTRDDKWHREGLRETLARTNAQSASELPNGTYELLGRGVQGNPYALDCTALVPHGCATVPDVPHDFDGLRDLLATLPHEGIVWHHADGRMVKLRRRDFGLDWPCDGARTAINLSAGG